MNTTMADGAAQRLVAQIGEALFGQPGLTLMELYNLCMDERSRSGFHPALHESIFRYYADESLRLRKVLDEVAECLPSVYYMDPPDGGNVSIPEQVRRMAEDAAHHRKAAPPSPAGQDALFTEELAELRRLVPSVNQKQALDAAIAALAARQPVAAAVKDSLTVGGGQAVAWMTHHDEPMLYPSFSEAAAYCDDAEPPIPLYAAPPAQAVVEGWSGWATQYPGAMPKLYGAREIAEVNHHPEEGQRMIFLSEQPAQAVDLGQFRDLIGFATYHAINLPETDPRRDFIRQANEFVALIDSQGVGNA